MDLNARAACDATHLARALCLAERGRGTTAPNPMVGCVIVNDGERVGEGWHERAGGPHAEVVALSDAGDRALGGTAYVTLEPCDHHGRTPPCSRALADAGIRRLVYALADPNPVARGGAATLEAAGVEVSGGTLAGVVAAQNQVFVANLDARPHITLKLAQTHDGALTAPKGRWITGTTARTHVHRLRSRVDAVLVGVGTVLADDPGLDVRHVPVPRGQPRAVVLDSRGRTHVDAKVVRPGTIVITTERAGPRWARTLVDRGVEVTRTAVGADGRVDLRPALAALLERGIHAILAEPGPTVAAALLEARLVDRCVVHVGGPSAPQRLADCLASTVDRGWATLVSRPLGDDRELVRAPGPTPKEP